MPYQQPPFQPQFTDKSVGVAFLLTFFFGPLGMFYTEVLPAIIMILAAIVLGLVTFGLALPFVWVGSIIWGCVSASQQHSRFLASVARPQGMGAVPGAASPFGTAGSGWAVAPPGPMVPPGWYADPWGTGMVRWWDGIRWTDHTQPPAPSP